MLSRRLSQRGICGNPSSGRAMTAVFHQCAFSLFQSPSLCPHPRSLPPYINCLSGPPLHPTQLSSSYPKDPFEFRSLFAQPSVSPMASAFRSAALFCFFVVMASSLVQCSLGARKLAALVQQPSLTLAYHQGHLLSGPISVNLIWYGKFSPAQRAVVADFFASVAASSGRRSTSTAALAEPSVAAWWKTTEQYYAVSKYALPAVSLGNQTLDESYSLGKTLTSADLLALAGRGGRRRAVKVVLTAEDVAVEGFCMSRCGTHGASPRSKNGRFAYIWVGNSATQCPGQCAWPFHQPIYGPQTSPLVAPNGDVGVDGMVINLGSLLAATFTNPFGDGFFQGPREAPLEAASACPGIYGKNAYPGYAGDLLVDSATGASYNANGLNGRKFLLPAIVDPATSSCSTLV